MEAEKVKQKLYSQYGIYREKTNNMYDNYDSFALEINDPEICKFFINIYL